MSIGTQTPLLEALRRLAQAALVFVPVPIIIVKGWRALTFHQDDQPWLLLVVLMIAPTVPIAIWWRERTHSRFARRAEAIVSGVAFVTGLIMLLVFGAWAGFLLTDPYSGPMATEGTLFLLIVASLGGAAALFFMVSPLLLDAQFFRPTFRKRAWKAFAYSVPALLVIALVVGPHFGEVFR